MENKEQQPVAATQSYLRFASFGVDKLKSDQGLLFSAFENYTILSMH